MYAIRWRALDHTAAKANLVLVRSWCTVGFVASSRYSDALANERCRCKDVRCFLWRNGPIYAGKWRRKNPIYGFLSKAQ